MLCFLKQILECGGVPYVYVLRFNAEKNVGKPLKQFLLKTF